MSAPRTLVAGLGNPGKKYEGTRHNFGWLVLDALVRSLDAEPARKAGDNEPSDQWRSGDVLLIKPTTFMNASGPEVRRVMDYYKIPTDRLLVIADELDLPFGTVQLKPGGGSAGHQGIASVMDVLGSGDFARLRLGIGRPPEGMDPTDFVLAPFDKDETKELARIVTEASDKAKEWLDV
ncbi:MAG: aminoacyl-tRNA hydrolase [bacterium]|nr:aminoacyl-tRNA hydrolase [bacterium]MDZ4248396.1 aminoacyl-tRNA hydrolase [Patescibacteria group bacterium]